ncbi:peptidase U4, partial [Clostridium botulinum]|nr:peptidase U4 [Clostridium botulinum]
MEVYIDILILENFIINLFLMILTMKILKYKV